MKKFEELMLASLYLTHQHQTCSLFIDETELIDDFSEKGDCLKKIWQYSTIDAFCSLFTEIYNETVKKMKY
jgi:hypothetical protein